MNCAAKKQEKKQALLAFLFIENEKKTTSN